MEKFDVDATPIMSVVVAGNRNLREVTEIAKKQIKERIETVQGVGAVIMVGGWERAVNIYVDPDRMAAYQISVLQVREALQKQNIEIPGGRVDQGNREMVLRTMGRMEDVPAFADLIVATYQGRPIRVRDIGRVENGVAEPRSRARLNDKNAVSLIVKKQSGTNVVSVVDAVKAKLAELGPVLPPDISTEVVDRPVALHQAHHLRGAAPPDPGRDPGGAHRLALHARRAQHADRVGRHPDVDHRDLHDDAVHELHAQQRDDARPRARGRHRHRRRRRHPREHLPPHRGARRGRRYTRHPIGTREIALAVTATTLSLIVIFLPVAFMGGIIGRFFQSFGVTVAFAIAISLLVSFTLTADAVVALPAPEGPSALRARKARFYRAIDRFYGACLRWSLSHRAVILLLSLAVHAHDRTAHARGRHAVRPAGRPERVRGDRADARRLQPRAHRRR